MDQITNFQTSDFTSEIWGLAQGYKQTASDTRLGLPRALNKSLQKTPAGIANAAKKANQIKALEKAVPGIAKGMTRVQEMRDTREQGKKIKIVVSFAIIEGTKKPALCDWPITRQKNSKFLMFWAARINRGMVSFYAVESVSKYYNLAGDCLSDGTVFDLLCYFYKQRHITKAQFEAKKFDMMLVVKHTELARIGNEEYALSQSQDLALAQSENADMLREELINMYLGEAIHKEFFTTALECEVNVPDFRFNVDGAILGILEPLEPGHISAALGLPFKDFIATHYLLCSPVDKDALTAAIHAFTHFTIKYTGNALVFCDLQGLVSRKGIMMLIDPQSHS
ncbi:hypothetical protein B0H14DRAFT_3514606 [Mycena olivaceomarginata]|nr:hypothetical protein B0H14DRAFT_3514606 [Mycena olivaceomarginata]